MTPSTAPAPNTAVTTSVTRRIPHGSKHEFLTWTERGIALAQRYPGFLGGGWLRSPTVPDHYHIVYRFRSHHDFDRWLTSGDRRSWAEGAPHTATDTTTTRLTGVEGWFDHRPAHAPVPRW
ncbi:antibiotic biosynthesis monooxygenase (plasmid) [Rhodococcus opacus]|uniref:Antibiotic biosynthesis monooxygenase n=1 Tax=Rhodococcus opacus TaxID=37919 RepID=A0ABT4NT05_RHOOP|nr:antibiotic biosynthesis monooxygenase [Rhodococcus opacus]MCZ4590519.1 antibiotic biosynthesis monooxygenase [Rhodococcus opacus]MDV7087604.1 antibiotic biosynthesis monooxygenase [Rhodococcus opacus]WKN61111.1 antibiotic biosynthesis monooxygenase [Rhodococcus opacus]